jgi:hypothetical protein
MNVCMQSCRAQATFLDRICLPTVSGQADCCLYPLEQNVSVQNKTQPLVTIHSVGSVPSIHSRATSVHFTYPPFIHPSPQTILFPLVISTSAISIHITYGSLFQSYTLFFLPLSVYSLHPTQY